MAKEFSKNRNRDEQRKRRSDNDRISQRSRSYQHNQKRSNRNNPYEDLDSRQDDLTLNIQDESRLEGRNAVEEALKAGRTFNKVWYLKTEADKRPDRRLMDIIRQLKDTEAVHYPVDRKALDRMAVTYNHQGIIAEVAAHEYVEIDDILELAKSRGEDPFLILLDQIQDSQNLGAILRTADCVGAHGVVITKRRSVSLDAAAAKASAGAIEYVPCARVTNLNQAIDELKEKGVWIAGLSMEGQAMFEAQNLTGALALVVGNEGKGISPSTVNHCDFLLSIPMRGKINSLNASNAAAIAMYEVLRARLSN